MSNIYLNGVDKMLEKAKEVSKRIKNYGRLVNARWAKNLIILMDGHSMMAVEYEFVNCPIYERNCASSAMLISFLIASELRSRN